jgi:hypothetical protein
VLAAALVGAAEAELAEWTAMDVNSSASPSLPCKTEALGMAQWMSRLAVGRGPRAAGLWARRRRAGYGERRVSSSVRREP